MKIKIAKEATCGPAHILPGEYWVALRHETREIALVSKGKDILLPATRRMPKGRGRTTIINFYCGGGSTWTLSVSSPTAGEWVAFVDYGKKDEEDRRRSNRS